MAAHDGTGGTGAACSACRAGDRWSPVGGWTNYPATCNAKTQTMSAALTHFFYLEVLDPGLGADTAAGELTVAGFGEAA